MTESTSAVQLFGSCQVPETIFEDIQIWSFYLTMRDGVKIAIDLILPEGLGSGIKIPALIQQTRYWRASEFRFPFKGYLKRRTLKNRAIDACFFFGTRGYALLNVDVRGTGASFGTLRHPWSPESIEDGREIADWIISQPWSNGRIGGFGTSYPGTSAEMLAVLNHPAIKVVIPKFNHPDGYLDIAFPGGLFNWRFIKFWGYFDKILDQNKVPKEFRLLGQVMTRGVKPVDGDAGRRLLKAAVKQHKENGPVYEIAQIVTFRDDVHQSSHVSMQDLLVERYLEQLKTSDTVVHGWGSWMDAGTGDAAIRRFLTIEKAGRAVIGAWDHGGMRNASTFLAPETPVSPSFQVQLAEMLRIFDAYLKDAENGVAGEKRLHYYTMGEEKWNSTTVWPPEAALAQRWYLAEDRKLETESPGVTKGQDVYTVDYSVSSGVYNRWWEMGIFDRKSVIYPDRAVLEGKVLAYTSQPMGQDVEITGHPVVKLYVKSNEPDIAFYVYLEDVAPDGRVTYLTEGLLRSIHRKISDQVPAYQIPIPHHTYKREDVMPMVPGEVACLAFGLFATSVLVRKGHCIRVSIAGHDAGTFRRVPEQGSPVINVYRNNDYASCIDLPVILR